MNIPEIFAITPLLVRATALVVVAGLATLALRHSAPAARHAIWIAALVGMIALPVATAVVPRWRVAMLDPAAGPELTEPAPAAAPASEASQLFEMGAAREAGAYQRTILPDQRASELSRVLLFVWLAGVLGVLAWLAAGRRALDLLSRKGRPVLDENTLCMLREECSGARVRRNVALVETENARMPLTWRLFQPMILLPGVARDWPAELRRAALRHELAHVARWDPLTQLVASVACAIYWFHPFVWLGARRARAEAERACDELVMARGLAPDEYAAHLLAVARSALSVPATSSPAIAMANRSHLHARIQAILHGSRPAAKLGIAGRLLLVAASAATVLTVSAFQPVRRARQQPLIISTSAGASSLEPVVVVADSIDQRSVSHASRIDGARLDTVIFLSIASSAEGTLYLELEGTSSVKVMGSDESRVRVTAHSSGEGSRHSRMLLERSGADVRLHQSIDGGKASHDLTNEVFISVPKGFRIKFAGETTVEVLNFESKKKMSDLDDVRIAGYVTFRPPPATKFVSQELYDQVKKLMTAVDSATAALRFGTAALRDSLSEVHSVPFVQITGGSSGMNTFVAEGGRLSSKTNPVADSVRSIQGASSQDQSGFAYLEGTSLDSISKSLHEIARNSPPEAAVRTLLRFIHGDSDVWVVYAAIDALGDVPGESGRKALEGVRKNTRDPSLRAFVTRLLNER